MFNQYPYLNEQDLNLDYILQRMKKLEETVAQFVALETVTFADPIKWNITSQYPKSVIVLDNTGNAYVSKKSVPAGVQLSNTDYWLEIFNFTAYIKAFDSNLTYNIEANTDRASKPYIVGDWLLLDDILYKVIAAISADELFVVDTNIERFTIEEFLKAFINYATGLINQYKLDIDASEVLYRQQLAEDIANTTASLQAQLNTAISGVTVDSEVINARVGYDNTVYPTLHDAITRQISDIHTVTDDITIVKNLIDASTFTNSQRYANVGGYVGAVTATSNYGTFDKIKLLKGHTYYTVFGVTGSFAFIGDLDDSVIGNVSTIVDSTEVRGTVTVQILKPTQDCYLYATGNSNTPSYDKVMVTEGFCPIGYYEYDKPIVELHNGAPIGEFHDVFDYSVMNFIANLENVFAYINTAVRTSWWWVDIKIPAGSYTVEHQIILTDKLVIEGVNTDKTIVDFIPDNPSSQDVEDNSLFLLTKNAVFKNLTMTCINGRYVVHCESANVYQDWTVKCENCKFIHYNNVLGAWDSQHAWGEGASSGSLLICDNCEFISEAIGTAETAAMLIHNNVGFTKSMLHIFNNCKFYGSDNNRAVTLLGRASTTDDVCIFNNCFFKGNIYNTSQQTIKAIMSACNLRPTNASTYFTANSICHYIENEVSLLNDTGATITAGTIVAFDSFFKMKVADDGDVVAGFVNEDVADGAYGIVIQKGYYRLVDVSPIGQRYKVSNGALAQAANGDVGISTGNGFVLVSSNLN